MKSRTIEGVFYAVVGVLLFSSKAVLAKLMYAEEVNSIQVLALRMGFALPFYVLFFSRDYKSFKSVSSQDKFQIILMGIIGYYLASYLDFKGLEYIDASLERLVLFAYPTFVVVINKFVFGQSISRKQLLAISLTYLGVAVVFFPELISGKTAFDASIGMVLVMGSALTYGSYLVFSQDIMKRVPVRLFTSAAMIVSSTCTLLHFVIANGGVSFHGISTKVLGLGMLVAVFATVIPSYFISWGISKIGANKVAILGALGPVSTISLAYLFLDEHLSIMQVIGASIIIIGVFQVKSDKA